MRFRVFVKKKILKSLPQWPGNIKERFDVLIAVLEAHGPSGPHAFKNYSKLGESRYHCHLGYSYVACWTHEKGTISIEVYYAGSRENAPY